MREERQCAVSFFFSEFLKLYSLFPLRAKPVEIAHSILPICRNFYCYNKHLIKKKLSLVEIDGTKHACAGGGARCLAANRVLPKLKNTSHQAKGKNNGLFNYVALIVPG